MASSQNLMQMGTKPPIYQINLSLPPIQRYVELATIYRDRMRALRGMFDELIHSISPRIPIKPVHKLAKLFLRRLYTADETDELRGISHATDIDLYLLICLNTVLDLLMGCTSGGVRVRGGPSHPPRMLHFRTLDWGMDPLRALIVELEFVRAEQPGQVLARSITYVGFVGVLTGVREDLSASLNFRPVHDESRNCAFYSNHALVLLGLRQSVSSLLRQCIVPPVEAGLASLASIVERVPGMPTTAAYLIFCDGKTAVTMEKDYRSAVVRSSESFIIATNHDQEPGSAAPETVAADKRRNHLGLSLVSSEAQVMADLVEDSNERRGCMQAHWDREVRKQNAQARLQAAKTNTQHLAEPAGTRSSLRLRQRREEQEAETQRLDEFDADDESKVSITEKQTTTWLTTFPVLNETTHYAAIMDPTQGRFAWVRQYDPAEWE
ncbi:beta subunit of N-acylethanolamine-hydrolyzing acid amidase-domain-containing protein [Penicillium hispanicum]|uniref:beta subunit of N-acylethanolamine-hydrolyzing acid amidase-domain-containing protein n=1 Tax=Penicillium hispanicum TaxID=1080232 RepID=UPI0025406C5F|nr:beta subunit of N-acylethanolamine-hydrolyzing acid amidase-domain-containing protein [Penicillium hispanicum]KAJ5573742.1 beta subunit of N-acylethanolamine-hydrolyzing acid amidase-domain-containing protein [Penicillium hispanicum]